MSNILQDAIKIRSNVRQQEYGDAVENFEKIAKIASIMSDKELTPIDCINIQIAVKLVRESYSHKTDNQIDLCGYADIKEDIQNSKIDMKMT